MKTTLFLATYFNNPHFIELQLKSFQKYIEDDFDFAVIDDAADDTISLLSSQLAKNEIQSECQKNGVRYIPIPQSVHTFVENGGLVPHDSPDINLHHPTERHQAVLRWILNNHKSLGFDQYKYLVILDADMFFKKPIKMSEYMENYDIMGAHREQTINVAALDQERRNKLSEEVKSLDGKKLNFFTMCLLFINMQTVKNLETMDNRSYRIITDTGGRTHEFIERNPQYKYLYLGDMNSQEYRVDFFFKKDRPYSEEIAEIIHYRGGSNWSYETHEYYFEKLNRMLERYVPEMYKKYIDIDHNVISRTGEHTFHKK
jgi:hypothetical protein